MSRDPYTYKWEKDPLEYKGVTTITEKQASDERAVYDILLVSLGVFDKAGIPSAAVFAILGNRYKIGSSGKLYTWKGEERRVAISLVNGRRRVVDRFLVVRCKLVGTDGSVLYDDISKNRIR